MDRFILHWRLYSVLFILFLNSFSIGFTAKYDICNDVEGLCDFPVNEILFGMVHNAMSSPSAGFLFFANHWNDPIVESLDEGYRGLSLDLCNCNGDLTFCHGGSEVGCGIGRRDPLETFTQINEWVTENPNNIVMIWLQINESAGDPISLNDVERLVQDVPMGNAGREFVDRLYRPENDDGWPTMSNLIQDEKQILFFYMGGPDGTEESTIGINYFYEYGMSTDWSYTSVPDLRETLIDGCEIQRDSETTRDFFMINTFVTKELFGYNVRPSRTAAEEINKGEFLLPLLEVCEEIQQSKVNIISVDFWKSGDLIAFINDQNSKLAVTLSSSNSTPTSSSTYFQQSEYPTPLQNFTHQPVFSMVPTSDDGDSIPSISKPWSYSTRMPNHNELSRTEVPSDYNDRVDIPSSLPSFEPLPFEKIEYEIGDQRSSKPQKKNLHLGEDTLGQSSEERSHTDPDQSTNSSPASSLDSNLYSLSEQQNEEKTFSEPIAPSTFLLGDDHLEGPLSSDAVACIFSFTQVAAVAISIFIAMTV